MLRETPFFYLITQKIYPAIVFDADLIVPPKQAQIPFRKAFV